MSSHENEGDPEGFGETDWNSFSINDLRNECERRGLPSQGSKRELVALIQEDQQRQNEELRASDSVSQAGSRGSRRSTDTSTQTATGETSGERTIAPREHETPQDDDGLSRVSVTSTSSHASLRELDAGARRAELAAEEEFRREIRRKKLEMEELESQLKIRGAEARENYYARVARAEANLLNVNPNVNVNVSPRPNIARENEKHPNNEVATPPLAPKPPLGHSPSGSQASPGMEGALERLISVNLRSNMPKIQIEPFDGDHTKYNTFIKRFQMCVGTRTEDDEEKLIYLEQLCKGQAKDIVRSCLDMNTGGYERARKLLQRRYGRQVDVIAGYVEKILSWPNMRPQDNEKLEQFSVLLITANNALKGVKTAHKELEHTKTIREMVEKLPYSWQERWRRVVDRAMREDETEQTINFERLVNFVEDEVRIQNHPIFGHRHNRTSSKTSNDAASGSRRRIVTAAATALLCPQCQGHHKITQCPSIENISPDDRVSEVRRLGLCLGCLEPGHRVRECQNRLKCHCGRFHATMFHGRSYPTRPDSDPPTAAALATNTAEYTDDEFEFEAAVFPVGAVRVGLAQKRSASSPRLIVLPVRVTGPNGRSAETYCFLDPGSTADFITDDLAKELGYDDSAPRTAITLMTVANESSNVTSRIIKDIQIRGLGSQESVNVPLAYTLRKIPAAKSDAVTPDDVKKWDHLRQLPLDSLLTDKVGIMLGSNSYRALEPLQVINGPTRGDPFGYLTRLGWVVQGIANDSRHLLVGSTQVIATTTKITPTNSGLSAEKPTTNEIYAKRNATSIGLNTPTLGSSRPSSVPIDRDGSQPPRLLHARKRKTQRKESKVSSQFPETFSRDVLQPQGEVDWEGRLKLRLEKPDVQPEFAQPPELVHEKKPKEKNTNGLGRIEPSPQRRIFATGWHATQSRTESKPVAERPPEKSSWRNPSNSRSNVTRPARCSAFANENENENHNECDSELTRNDLTEASIRENAGTKAAHRELERKNILIAQLISRNEELTSTKERQISEINAQRQTANELREHVALLNGDLAEVEANIDEEVRRRLAL